MSRTAAKAKNITEEMRGIDWSIIDNMRRGTGYRRSSARELLAEQMEGEILQSQVSGMKKRQELEAKKTEIEIKQMERALTVSPSVVMGPGGMPVPSGAESELEKMLRTPQFMAEWRAMSPEERQSYFQMVQSMQMQRNPYSPYAFQGMNPMMMGMNQQPQINVKDLMAMFTQGMSSTIAMMQTQTQTNPLDMVNSVVGIMKPFMDRAETTDRELMKAQIDAITKKGSMAEQVQEIRAVMETFYN